MEIWYESASELGTKAKYINVSCILVELRFCAKTNPKLGEVLADHQDDGWNVRNRQQNNLSEANNKGEEEEKFS